MKKTILFIFAITILFANNLCAQNYNKMWKDVAAAQQRDLPRTALSSVDKIIATARKKSDGDQLLKALIVRMQLSADISADSATALLPRFVQLCGQQQSEPGRSIFHLVLGWLLQNRNTELHPLSKDSAYDALALAVSQPDLLAQTRSKDWQAILQTGADSRIYGHDMLSVVMPFAARQLSSLNTAKGDSLALWTMHQEIAHYSKANNRPAQMMAMMDSASILGVEDSAFFAGMIRMFPDVEEVSAAYVRLCQMSGDSAAYAIANEGLKRCPKSKDAPALKNIITRLTQSSAGVSVLNGGDSIRLIISHQNLKEATIGICRLAYGATSPQILNLQDKDMPAMYSRSARQKRVVFAAAPEWKEINDTVCIEKPQNGMYLVRISAPDCKAQYSLLRVSGLAVMQMPQPDEKVRVSVVDAHNGAPIAGATLKVATQNGSTRHWQTLQADEQGQLLLSNPRGYATLYPSTPTDNAHEGVSLIRSYAYAWNRPDDYTSASLHTDRAIYRPGQKVRVGGFIYHKSGDSVRALGGEAVELTLNDANGKKVETAHTVSDEFGAFGVEYTLPQNCLNGTFSVRHARGYASFRVEEYKRPNFRVSLVQPQSGYALGDTVRIAGRVETYSGFPLARTKVAVTTRRTRSWWVRQGEYDGPVSVKDTVMTDSEGRFTVAVVLTGKARETAGRWPRFYSFDITARATSLDGESEEAALHLSAGTAATSVSTNLSELLCREKASPLGATQVNSNGQTVAGAGKYIVYKGRHSAQEIAGETDKDAGIVSKDAGIVSKDTGIVSKDAGALAPVLNGEIRFNKTGELDTLYALPSGEYTIAVFPTDDADVFHAHVKAFTLFSLSDTRPASARPLMMWQSGDFQTQDTVDVIVATALRDTWIRYDLTANARLIESRLIHVSDSVLHFRYHWDESWGNGAQVQFALLSDGQLLTRSTALTKPTPNKTLTLEWATFRDHLQPGATETWTLRVLHEGRPVSASVLATMYDASLDKIIRHSMDFSLGFNRFVPHLNWAASHGAFFSLSLWKDYTLMKETPRLFTHPDNNLFGGGLYTPYRSFGRPMMLREVALQNASVESKLAMPMMADAVGANADATTQTTTAETATNILDAASLRTDFSETAFFAPSLHTDSNGEARIQFTLPQSLTQWNFMALAHTANLCYGSIDTTLTVSKPFMVQANMPRFLRQGDKAMLAITVRNSSDAAQSGKMQMEIKDAATGKRLMVETRPFSVEARKDTVVTFPVDAPTNCPLLICRYAAASHEFSDGEQQYLPVLEDMQLTLTTVPFTLTNTQPATIDLGGLDYKKNGGPQRLTVEYTGNPAWTAINALPSTLNYRSQCLTQLAANYCALTLMRHILQQNPQIGTALAAFHEKDSIPAALLPLENNEELKQLLLDETPWVGAAEQERSRLEALSEDSTTMTLKQLTMLHRLRQMQTAEGGWQWFPGMPASLWLTMDVTEMLVRLQKLVPTATADIQPMISRATAYLDNKAMEAMGQMKKDKATTIPPLWMRYLYISTMPQAAGNGAAMEGKGSATDGDAKSAKDYLLKRLDASATGYDMYNKALAACILARTNRKAEAALTMRSLLEHTVATPTMGRYFDSRRAPQDWQMYRIPTQIAAIEAVGETMPMAKDTLNELRLWLLQSKHTQSWADALTACRAVECLLEGPNSVGENFASLPHGNGKYNGPSSVPAKMELAFANGHKTELMDASSNKDGELAIDPFIQMGYVKATLGSEELTSAPRRLMIVPSAAAIEQQTAFGAVYLQSWQRSKDIAKANSGIGVEATLWVETDTPQEHTATAWRPLTAKTSLRVGDRLKVRYVITAGRDLDFVSLKDGHAACMEPEDNLSGYDWRTGSYREVGDASTTLFFLHLSKGEHVVELIYSIDRSGAYSSATIEAQCQYAPEIIGRAKAYSLVIK